MWTRWCRAIVALGVVGCADVPPEVDEPSLELGTGTFRFEAVEDGEALPLVFGAQGGWHVWVAVRVRGVDGEAGSFEVTHYPVDDPELRVRTSHGIRLDPPNAEGARSYVGWPAILRDPPCAVGRLYRIEATFRPASGGRLTAERDVLIDPGEHPPPECVPGEPFEIPEFG